VIQPVYVDNYNAQAYEAEQARQREAYAAQQQAYAQQQAQMEAARRAQAEAEARHDAAALAQAQAMLAQQQAAQAAADAKRRDEEMAARQEQAKIDASYEQKMDDLVRDQARSVSRALRNAMKGLGTNEAAMIEAIAPASSRCLAMALQMYASEFKRSLISDIKDETSGNFETACVLLFQSQPDLDARNIREAMAGIGTDEDRIDEILLFRSGVALRAISNSYRSIFDRDLFDDLRSECSAMAADLYITACTDRTPHNPHVVDEDVKSLYDAGAGKTFGTDEETFARVMTCSDPQHMEAVKARYAQLHGKTLSQVIKDEFDEDDDYVRCMSNMAMGYGNFIGERLLKSMKGAGTDEKMLMRLLFSHRESGVLPQASTYIHAKTNKTLVQWIRDECSGDFENLLVAVCRAGGVNA